VSNNRKSQKRKSYHHGDLRRAVLDAAWDQVAEHGLRELTLREVARRVGVTHAAPYHHFSDREALLDALADEAYGELDAAMSEAKRGVEDASERLFVLGRAYVDFARRQPERIEVMFRRKKAPAEQPPELGARAFQHLVDAIAACQQANKAPQGDVYALVLSAWSLVHGFALLSIEGALDAIPPYQGNFEALRDTVLRNSGFGLEAAAARQRDLGS
jgi:AcrR family transcriptional regulator